MGEPKGRLRAPESDVSIVEKLAGAAANLGLPVALVGRADDYADLVPDLPRLQDEPIHAGPLGGLHALLQHAAPGWAIALGCDMPFVDVPMLNALIKHAENAPDADVISARRDVTDPWEPLFALYRSARVLPVLRQALQENVRSFQQLLRRVQVASIEPTPAILQALRDWDTPEDIG